MSGSGIAAITGGALGAAIAASTAAKTQLDTLTQQVSSGHVSDSYAGLGASAQAALSLQPQIAQLTAQQSAIGAVTGRLGVTQAALTQINGIATSFNAQLANLNGISPSEVDSVAAGARSALQQMASLLDSTDGGTYVFGGTDSANPPVPNPDAILASGFYTQIGAAVDPPGGGGGGGGAAPRGRPTTAASTLKIASSDAPGTTPFSGPPGQAPTLTLGSGADSGGAAVQVGVLANANTLVASSGPSTTGSYTRDILRGLATLANLSSTQVNAAGFTALVQDTRASLTGAIGALNAEGGVLGNTQATLQARQAQASDTSTALTAQLSSVQDVDLAKTLSSLSAVQTQLSASYKLISEVSSLSLVKYL